MNTIIFNFLYGMKGDEFLIHVVGITAIIWFFVMMFFRVVEFCTKFISTKKPELSENTLRNFMHIISLLGYTVIGSCFLSAAAFILYTLKDFM